MRCIGEAVPAPTGRRTVRAPIAGMPKTTSPALAAVSDESPAGVVAIKATTYSIAKAAVLINAVGAMWRQEARIPSDQPRASVRPTGVAVAPTTTALPSESNQGQTYA